jgi:hypothetical protein
VQKMTSVDLLKNDGLKKEGLCLAYLEPDSG